MEGYRSYENIHIKEGVLKIVNFMWKRSALRKVFNGRWPRVRKDDFQSWNMGESTEQNAQWTLRQESMKKNKIFSNPQIVQHH